MKYSPHLKAVLSLGEGPAHNRQGLLLVNQARRMEDEKVLWGEAFLIRTLNELDGGGSRNLL